MSIADFYLPVKYPSRHPTPPSFSLTAAAPTPPSISPTAAAPTPPPSSPTAAAPPGRRPRPRRPHHPAVDLIPGRRLPPHPSDPKAEVVPVYLPCVCAYIVGKREEGLPQLLLRLLPSHVPIAGRLATSLTLPLSMVHRGTISGGRRHRISCRMVFPCSIALLSGDNESGTDE
ncbi:sulfated surface glycoprotein 185 [Triticum aestivum]|uniref:sulfated surface glycoprotein 185 n=1 Tax=Triticum aestivum TaxID=4565 RepID=UPI001D016028|nr:sulfated surface glycoprotein 185-like [Triticum aestivum]